MYSTLLSRSRGALTTGAAGLGYGALLGALSVAALACGSSTRVEEATGGSGGGGGGEPWGATVGSGAGTSTGGGSSSSGAGAGEPWSGPLEHLDELDLGEVPLNTSKKFPVPDRAIGLTVLAEAPQMNDLIGLQQLQPPAGGSVIFNYAMANHSLQVFANYGFIGGSNPQSDSADAWPMQEGSWTVRLGDDDGSVSGAHVRVWVRRTSDGAFHGGVVDVNVFLAPNVTTQNYVNQVLANMFADYAGLGLGNVNFYPLAASASTLETYEEYRQMLATSAGIGTTPALNFFVIGNFGAEFGDAIGVAGGIPGSPMRHGTPMSGVAYEPSGNPEYDASVMRHEVGHLAGLFHTTEYAVQETDPLSDTIECATSTMQSTPDKCPDVTNAMFPIAFGATTLTQGQVRVLQGSALYRGVLQAGGQPSPPMAPPPGSKMIMPQPPAFAPDAEFAARRPNKAMPTAPTSLERVLGSVWCTHGKADYEGLAIRTAGANAPAALRAIVVDEAKAEIMRSRALGAYVHAAKGNERTRALDLADQLARTETASTDLRISALRALAREAPSRASLVAKAAEKTSDALVRAVAQRLLPTQTK